MRVFATVVAMTQTSEHALLVVQENFRCETCAAKNLILEPDGDCNEVNGSSMWFPLRA